MLMMWLVFGTYYYASEVSVMHPLSWNIIRKIPRKTSNEKYKIGKQINNAIKMIMNTCIKSNDPFQLDIVVFSF